jgi:valyl-tRNA synthetase
LGNSPEPLDLIAEYGADAVRFTILYLAPLGQDILYSREKNEIGRNFANKIWNAGRFLLLNRDQNGGVIERTTTEECSLEHMDLADRWILSRLHSTTAAITAALSQFEINKVSKTVYDFFWHDYCDWYLEMVKSRLYGTDPADVKRAVITRAIDVYDAALRILHPFMPFVTEELWQALRPRKPLETIMRARLLQPDPAMVDEQVETEMEFVQRIIESLRTLRSEMGIPPGKDISLVMRVGEKYTDASIQKYEGYLQRLARVQKVMFLADDSRPKLAASSVVEGAELFVPLEGVIDIEQERARLGKEIERASGMLDGVRRKLSNQNFVERAPKEVVDREREKLESFAQKLEKLEKNLEMLNN